MIEEWRKIVGYEGLYEVSNTGRVRSVDRYDNRNCFRKGKVLSPRKDKDGYLQVGLYCNGKQHKRKVHRLVAQAFIENPDNLPEVNHKDEDKTNNNVDNLEWCTAKYNLSYGTARIRSRNTNIKNGYWTGLSEKEYKKKYYQENTDKLKEYRKKWYQENKDRICEQQRTYYLKKKEQIQNNVKSLNDQI